MIKLTQISKIYKSKSGVPVTALSNVDIELGSRGMVFILGKSGSGKSTLLNLLGGMDTPTAGEIEVDGVSMNSFKQSDLDGYRNGYVGFVFQEYNLLSDFNVKDNIAISLQFNGSELNEKVIKALKEVELSEEYLTRRTGELSGGEKQRVAIARALVKDSKMILADEPTGNLDSATRESVWNILKRISEERLVVAVTHDKESAEKYGDRIIEIADGQIVSDSGEKKQTESNEPLKLKKKRLPFAACLKMGFNSLRKRKARSIVLLLIAALSMAPLAIMQTCATYTPEPALVKCIKDNGVDKVFVAVNGGSLPQYPYSDNISNEARKYVEENSISIRNGCVNSKRELLDMGFTFMGEAAEIDDNSLYIRYGTLKHHVEEKKLDITLLIDGNEIDSRDFDGKAEDLLGQKIKLWKTDPFLTIAGIINDGKYVPDYITTEANYYSQMHRSLSFNGGAIDSNEAQLTLECGAVEYNGSFVVDTYNIGGYKYMTEDGIVNVTEESLRDDEIMLSFQLYKLIFGAESLESYIDMETKTLKSLPEHIGETVSIVIRDSQSGETEFEFNGVKLKGVEAFSFDGLTNNRYSILCSPTACHNLFWTVNHNGFIVRTDSVNDMQKYFTDLRRLGAKVSFELQEEEVSRLIYYFAEKMDTFSIIFAAVGAVMLTVTVLMVISLISFSVADRKREIGILSAVGVSKQSIVWMFVLEILIIAVLTFILGVGEYFLAVKLINDIQINKDGFAIQYVIADIRVLITLVVATVGLMTIAAVPPLIKTVKSKPADIIRE